MRGTITLFFFLVYLLVFPLAVAAQEISVSGKVTDQGNGQPLPGVTIKVQGTNRVALPMVMAHLPFRFPQVLP